MAMLPPGMQLDNWVRDEFLRSLEEHPPALFETDWFRARPRPTEASIKADVDKLRSVSAAARAWIADRRMAIASVGSWRGTFIIPKDGKYPLLIVKARQEGVTYTTRLVVNQTKPK